VRPIDQPDHRYQLGRRRVVPDVSVPAAQALDITYAKALRDVHPVGLGLDGGAVGVRRCASRRLRLRSHWQCADQASCLATSSAAPELSEPASSFPDRQRLRVGVGRMSVVQIGPACGKLESARCRRGKGWGRHAQDGRLALVPGWLNSEFDSDRSPELAFRRMSASFDGQPPSPGLRATGKVILPVRS
jgi:hypothetical protein